MPPPPYEVCEPDGAFQDGVRLESSPEPPGPFHAGVREAVPQAGVRPPSPIGMGVRPPNPPSGTREPGAPGPARMDGTPPLILIHSSYLVLLLVLTL